RRPAHGPRQHRPPARPDPSRLPPRRDRAAARPGAVRAPVGDVGTAADQPRPPAVAATTGPVRVVGTGLLGTSIGLALRTHGVDVLLEDPSRTTLRLACDVGAGRLAGTGDVPRLVVVAAPPDATPDVVLA